ncbi:MAG: peptidyl-prolyl cis-trans isomerase [Saprospiraceae bacterium]
MQKILREPLFHFLLIGAGLFCLYSFLNPSEEQLENNVIRIEESDVTRLIKAYQQNWNAPPDSATLKSLLKEEIKAEVFYREALRMQLDHNDEIIRRRLKQKYEFLVKDLADSQQPNDAELQTFYQTNSNLYQEPTKLSFSQIYFSPDKRKTPLADAETVLTQLNNSTTSTIDIKKIGDNFHLQNYFAERDYNDVRQLFGQDFSKAVFANKTTGWTAPIRSGYGIHLVNISAIQEASIRPFSQVKEKVEADWKISQQQLYNEQLYKNLLKKYEVEYDLKKWGEE